MLHIKEKTECCGCKACEQACPQHCIQMLPDSEGFFYPKINEEQCVQCGLCERICPMTKKFELPSKEVSVSACKIKDEPVRMQSSSGGIFSLLSSSVLKQGGAVFGAAVKRDKVFHKMVQEPEQLPSLRGSKYVQSDMGDCFKLAQNLLKQNKKVLFFGTPCQIAGLHSFLGRDYESLLAVDCVCLGVPSPGIFSSYVKYREAEANAKLDQTIFRDKSTGWKEYSITMLFDDSSFYSRKHSEDPYLRGFGKCLFLRPACYSCRFKGMHRASDITLGDYWGISGKYPEFDDDKGISLVIVNTPKGMEAFDLIREELNLLPSTYEHAKSTHPSLIQSIPPSPKREEFFQRYSKEPVMPLLHKMSQPSSAEKLRHAVGDFLRKTGIRK